MCIKTNPFVAYVFEYVYIYIFIYVSPGLVYFIGIHMNLALPSVPAVHAPGDQAHDAEVHKNRTVFTP